MNTEEIKLLAEWLGVKVAHDFHSDEIVWYGDPSKPNKPFNPTDPDIVLRCLDSLIRHSEYQETSLFIYTPVTGGELFCLDPIDGNGKTLSEAILSAALEAARENTND